MKHFPDRNLFIYYATTFLSGLGFFIPVWLLWYTKFISMSTIGVVEGLGIILGTILEVPTGAFADIFGRKTSVIIGKFGIAVGAFTIALATNSTQFIISIFIWNAFYSFINGANTAIIYDHLKSQGKEDSFAQVNVNTEVIGRLGIIIGSFAGGAIYSFWQPLPYLLFGFTTVLEMLLWFFMTEPKIDSQRFNFAQYWKTITDGFRGVSHSAHIRLISFITTTIFAYAFLFRSYLDYSYALDLGLNPDQQSILFGITGIIKLITIFYIGYQIKNRSRGKIIFGFLLLFSSFLFGANFAGFCGGILVIVLVESMAAASTVIANTYINKEIDSSIRATAMSFINMFAQLMLAVGLFMGMFFIERFKSPIVFTSFGIVLFILTVIFLFQYQKQKHESNN